MRLSAGVVILIAASIGAAVVVHEELPPPRGTDPDLLPTPPPNIVSTNLPTDEMLLGLLPPDAILAVSIFADDPIVSNVAELAARVPERVRGDSESIAALRPGVVFTFPFSRPEGQALLRSLDVPIVHIESPQSIAEIHANLRLLGRIIGAVEKAEAIVTWMNETIDEVASRVRDEARPRVLLYNRSGFTAGANTLFDELVQIAGGRNVAAEFGLEGIARLPDEVALQMDPDVIFVLDYRADAQARDVVPPEELTESPLFQHVQAVRHRRVFTLTGRYILSTSQHAVRAARVMAQHLHPHRFEDAS